MISAVAVVTLDVTFLILGFEVVFDAEALGGVIAGAAGFLLVALQVVINLGYNKVLAENTESILTFNYNSTQRSSRNGRPVTFRVDSYFDQSKDQFDFGKVTKELLFGFNVGPWKAIRYAADVIRDVASASNPNLKVSAKTSNLAKAARDFYHVKNFLGLDFLQSYPAYGDLNATVNGRPIAPAPPDAGEADERVNPGAKRDKWYMLSSEVFIRGRSARLRSSWHKRLRSGNQFWARPCPLRRLSSSPHFLPV